jgi:type 1 glutamine amidotransferase
MRSVLAFLALATSFWFCSERASLAGKEQPVRVLLVLAAGGSHDSRKMAPILEKALEKAGNIKVTRLEPPADKNAGDGAHLVKLADLKRSDHDVLVFYTVGNKLDQVQERALEKFVEEGGGVVAIHGASASFGNSQVWFRLVGGRFTGHLPGLHKLQVVPDPQHPVTAGLAPFTIVDEEYTHKLAEVDRTVLAKFEDRPKGSKGTNNDVVWAREIGKGRVVYTALGHGKEAWENPAWQQMTVQAILWTVGQLRQVKLSEKDSLR